MSHLAELVASAKAAISQASDVAALDNVRVEYLGKKRALNPSDDDPAVSCRQKSVRQLVRLSMKRKSRFSRR